ncbi:hypothetical protein KAU51_00655 [Candidatus Parcubacteria bacterium]|nr:hypothetical protein [Candidatus Parcubacteria bacterium]
MKKIISALVLMSLLALPVIVLAQAAPEDPPDVEIWAALDTITTYLFGLLIIIAVIFLILAAVQYVTASGDPEKIKSAHQKVLYALIGIIVGVLARGLVIFVRGMVGNV